MKCLGIAYEFVDFSLDDEGGIAEVRHSIPQRDSYFITNLNNVIPWYRALKIFVNGLNANAAMFKLEPGKRCGFS